MTFAWNTALLRGIGSLLLCLFGATGANAQKPQVADEVFKDIRLLKGMSVDQFMDTMGFFSASTNLNCTGCHGAASGGDWSHYADETPMKVTARRMILLMQRINKENFGGAPIVTCYTCHRGDMHPEGTPSLAVQYGTPIIDPDAIEINKQAAGAPSAAELFDKYIQAVGGSQRVAAVASFAAKGTYNGYDTEFENAKTFPLKSMARHQRSGRRSSIFEAATASPPTMAAPGIDGGIQR